MAVTLVIDAAEIVDWETFHDVFAREFGFPDFYGRNMSAWVDCLSDLDDPSTGMTSIHVSTGETLALIVENAADFKRRCFEQYEALVECAAFVNWRVLEFRGRNADTGGGRPLFAGAPLIALAFCA